MKHDKLLKYKLFLFVALFIALCIKGGELCSADGPLGNIFFQSPYPIHSVYSTSKKTSFIFKDDSSEESLLNRELGLDMSGSHMSARTRRALLSKHDGFSDAILHAFSLPRSQ